MTNEQLPTKNENSDEGEPLSPEEEIASLEEKKQEAIRGYDSEDLKNEKTVEKIGGKLEEIDQKIEGVTKKAREEN